MPTESKPILIRIFCKTCNRYEIHNKMYDDEIAHTLSLPKEDAKISHVCSICNTAYSDILISDIPREEILIQRERYKEQKKRQLYSMMNFLSKGEEIYESDAGYEKLKEAKRIAQEKQKSEDLQFIQPYKNLQRNAKCVCGSNKKYKQCCLNKVNDIMRKY